MIISKTRHPSHRLVPVAYTLINEFIIISISFLILYPIHLLINLDSFLYFIFFFLIQATMTLIVLKINRLIFKFSDGVYNINTSHLYDIFLGYSYITIVNLGFFWLLPYPGFVFRNFIYKWLGCKKDKTSILNVAILYDSFLTEIGKNSFIGGETRIIAHLETRSKGIPRGILARVRIGQNVIVGFNTKIMPGVSIGDNSIIHASSFIPMYTKIPPNEEWGGSPVKKIRDIEEK